MNISIFLSQVLGIYLVFISIAFVMREEKLQNLMLNILSNSELMLISGFIALILGILLVVAHNVWVMDWRVIITLIGWLALFKGASIILYSDWVMRMSQQWMDNKVVYFGTFLFVFLIGSILIYFGYMKN